MQLVACATISVMVPVLSGGAGFARMVGHHLWWTLIWIATWRAVERLGLVTVGVCIVTLLTIGMLVLHRQGTSKKGKRDKRTGAGAS